MLKYKVISRPDSKSHWSTYRIQFIQDNDVTFDVIMHRDEYKILRLKTRLIRRGANEKLLEALEEEVASHARWEESMNTEDI